MVLTYTEREEQWIEGFRLIGKQSYEVSVIVSVIVSVVVVW